MADPTHELAEPRLELRDSRAIAGAEGLLQRDHQLRNGASNSRNNAVRSGWTGFRVQTIMSNKKRKRRLTGLLTQCAEIFPGTARIFYSSEETGGEQFHSRWAIDCIREYRNVVEIDGYRVIDFLSELQEEGPDGVLVVTEVKRRHQQHAGNAIPGSIARQLDRAVEGGMGDVHQQWQTAAFGGELHHVAAVVQREMNELASGPKQRNSVSSARG